MSDTRELPEFSVSQFVTVFNQSLEMLYPAVSVFGEIANFKISKNRWVYFDLKDEEASIRMFGTVYSLPGPMEDGMQVQIVGQPRLHNTFGFSISFTKILPVGEGSIKKANDLLYKKLEKEGLFDVARKREIPYPPDKIALISSKESAGYGDFLKIVRNRWTALEIKTYDVQVQGADALEQIISAIKEANLSEAEVIVIVRGGGSKDDLASFDHEQVVRAVASSRIPTLMAIGHERDESLAELASDLRASTPSNAGEILVPDRTHEIKLLEQKMYTLDTILSSVFAAQNEQIGKDSETMYRLFTEVVNREKHELVIKKQVLSSLDPRVLLSQGYAVVKKAGKRILSKNQLKVGDGLEIILGDGTVHSTVDKV